MKRLAMLAGLIALLVLSQQSWIMSPAQAGGAAPMETSGQREKALADLARSASTYLDVCTRTLALPSLTAELIAAAQRGVQVRVILDRGSAPGSWNQIIRLAPARIPVRGTPWGESVRESFLIADRSAALAGTWEWRPDGQARSAGDLRELGGGTPDLTGLVRQFDGMWADRRFVDLLSSSANSSAADRPIAVSAQELYLAFQDNAVAASEKYGDKLVTVTGRVYAVEPIQGGGAALVFNVNDWDGFPLGFVACEFPADRMPSLGSVGRGQAATVSGICRGRLTLSSVLVSDCKLERKR